MTIEVTCQSCGKLYRVPDERAGQRFKCKSCEAVVEVPGGEPRSGGRSSGAGKSSGGGGGGDPWGQGDPFAGLSSAGEAYSNESAYSDPYSAPPMASGAPTRSRGGKEAAKKRTMLPAIFLYIVASLSILNHLGGIVLSLMGESTNPFMPQGAGGVDQAQLAGAVIGGIVGVLCDILVIVGAYNMQQMKSYGLALTGAIIATVPCCICLILGMPFGIWSLVVINSADVKPHFD